MPTGEVSATHLPRYLTEFSHRFNRRSDLGEMLSRLGWIVVRTAPASYRMLKMAEYYG